jgi:hypothetical protein
MFVRRPVRLDRFVTVTFPGLGRGCHERANMVLPQGIWHTGGPAMRSRRGHLADLQPLRTKYLSGVVVGVDPSGDKIDDRGTAWRSGVQPSII